VATIELRSSKMKALLLTLGGVGFVLAGLWIVLFADEITFRGANRTEFNELVGWLVVLFFGIGSIISGRLIFSSKTTVLIAKEGLTLMPDTRKKQFIPWDNIDNFSVEKLFTTKLIAVNLNNTKQWLENETNPLRKKLMQFNVKQVGTPFAFPASLTRLSNAKLLDLLNLKLSEYKNDRAPVTQPELIPTTDKSIAITKDNSVLITWSFSMQVWWSIFWRSILYGLVAGFVFGAIAGFFTALFGNGNNSAYNGAIAGYVGSLLASMLALKHALGKHVTPLKSAYELAGPNKV
jgi:hypothetical protein